ncbi:hypothetical protein F891_01191 [Acinetobacter sp. CIP 101966]|uniref:restriction endonuclease subunit S n=1 Tax=Acinetobacter sp. CIP 101966 TaxID=1144662 RepID=UPI0002CE0975|nr:restriction endonuclease subunit S [Acinetobacter sp. CIP 101966]ENX28344.1 hypothetical protein F891_01191 [Acinetobacter sp. CIP 101966]
MTDVKQLITEHLDIWLTAETEKKSGRGRSSGSNDMIYGVQKLRELILDLAISGSLVKTHSTVQFEQEFFSLNKSNSKKIDTSVIKEKLNDTIFKIPSSWAWETLGNLFYFENGDRGKNYPNKDCLVEIGIPFVNAGHLKNDSIDIHEMTFITQDKFDTLNSGKFKEGDILYCLRGSLGKYAVVQKDLKGAIASSLVILRAYENSFIDYISLFLQSNFAKKQIKIYDNGTAQPNLSSADLRKFLVPMPSKEERSQIVEKVDELMQLCDQLEQQQTLSSDAHATLVDTLLKALTESSDADDFQGNWQRIVANFDVLFTTEHSIEQLKQTVLQLAVMGKLVKQDPSDEPASELLKKIADEKAKLIQDGKIKKSKPLPEIAEDEKPFELPSGWAWVRLENISELITKGSSPKWQGVNYVEEGLLFITSENVGSYSLILENMKYVEEKFNEIEPRSILEENDFLMNIVGGSIGRTAIYDLEKVANINQAVCLIRLFLEYLDKLFLLHFFNSEICKNYMFDKQVDNARPNLSMGNISKFLIPIPPIKEQKLIIEKVNEIFSMIEQLQVLQSKLQKTKLHLADALVANAVEGV